MLHSVNAFHFFNYYLPAPSRTLIMSCADAIDPGRCHKNCRLTFIRHFASQINHHALTFRLNDVGAKREQERKSLRFHSLDFLPLFSFVKHMNERDDRSYSTRCILEAQNFELKVSFASRITSEQQTKRWCSSVLLLFANRYETVRSQRFTHFLRFQKTSD